MRIQAQPAAAARGPVRGHHIPLLYYLATFAEHFQRRRRRSMGVPVLVQVALAFGVHL